MNNKIAFHQSTAFLKEKDILLKQTYWILMLIMMRE